MKTVLISNNFALKLLLFLCVTSFLDQHARYDRGDPATGGILAGCFELTKSPFKGGPPSTSLLDISSHKLMEEIASAGSSGSNLFQMPTESQEV